MKKNYEMEELIPIVSNLVEIYTGKDSTSVSYEVARQLMAAVLYCIREYEESTEEVSTEALVPKQEVSAKEAYQKGYDIVIGKVMRSKKLYEDIILNFIAYRNIGYQDTIIKGMPNFFLRYDPTLNPQDHLLTLDYPTIGSIEGKCGVDAIEQYLQYIRLEQLILEQFPEDYVLLILEGFHKNHKNLLINLSSIVMHNMIGHVIMKKPISEQGYVSSDYDSMKILLQNRTKEEVEEMLSELVRVMVTELFEENQELLHYYMKDVKDFSVQLKNAVEHNCLQKIFII